MRYAIYLLALPVIGAALGNSGCSSTPEPQTHAGSVIQTALPTTQPPQSGQTSRPPPSRAVVAPNPQVLATASDLIRAKRYEEAEIVLAREVQANPDELQSRSMLFVVYKALAERAIAVGEFAEADLWIGSANTAQLNMKGIAMQPGVPLPDRDLQLVARKAEEVKVLKANLNNAADAKCVSALHAADRLADEARKLILKNDRNKVIEGLKQVRVCVESQRWITADRRAEANQRMNFLLKLVSEKEHDQVLAAAGLLHSRSMP